VYDVFGDASTVSPVVVVDRSPHYACPEVIRVRVAVVPLL